MTTGQLNRMKIETKLWAIALLVDEVLKGNPATAKQVQEEVYRRWHIRVSKDFIHQYMVAQGFSVAEFRLDRA